MKIIFENGKLYKIVEKKEEINVEKLLKENEELKSKGNNTGNYNTGNWNIGNCNTGNFNIDNPKTIRCFGVEVDRGVWGNAYKPGWLYFNLTEWIEEKNMTDEEKENNPLYKTTGGYLKKYNYKEAFKMSYDNASQEDRDAVKKLPGFNSDIFYEISGIRL